jgi:predicted nucleotidyltransferase
VFEELLAGLARANVRFVVVGGLAVVIQGYARLTADVDLVLDLGHENVQRAIESLLARGLRPLLPVNALDFADIANRTDWEPIPFEELWSRADSVELGGETVRVASIDDLIRMKRAASRPQDAIDIAQLEAIARRRNA